MKRIAIIHNKFSTTGGAETVFMNSLEAIQGEYSVSLFSFDKPDLTELNDFCGTDVNPVPIHCPEVIRPVFNAAISAANGLTNGKFGPHIQLKTAILNRLVRDRTTGYDLRISTGNELALDHPSVQYVHFPMFNRRLLDGEVGVTGRYNRGYDTLCSLGAGVRRGSLTDTTVLTNSEWTAKRVEHLYDTSARVVYPPVNVHEFDPQPWEERSPGFVTIGRISPDKNQLELIEIVQRVRELGHDVKLHIIGPSANYNDDYNARVTTAAKQYEFVEFEGKMSRPALVRTLCSNRYGIHGKPNEHFGITVAELVAGGTLPFVPNSGGQVELVNRQSDLLYESVDDAVETIDAVLSDPDRQQELRDGLPNVSETLGQDRFQTQFKEIVDEHLQE